ncbi:MAG: YihY/virulence factor BrkB family protein [Candidatus Eremiobacteraeota bacterium]|nr:YihY/virulence factor BrkB family protein [Candidatus Eremiobacteraeota bacterium]
MNVVDLTRSTFAAFNDDKAQRLAAAIAFSTIFSLAPLFVILIAVVGGLLDLDGTGGHTNAENSLLAEIAKNAGASAADTVRKLIDASFDKPRQGAIAQTIGWIAFAFTASNLFASLQDALNAVWHVEAPKGGWKQMVRARSASFAMIVVVGFLLVVTFVANAIITFVGAHFLSKIPVAANPTTLTIVEQLTSIVLTTVVFALLFKVLPDVKVAWRDVWIGASVTAVLFVFGEALISLYIAYGGVASAYEAAGSILVALVWIYYSAMILLLGAEFTKVFAENAELTVPANVRHLIERPAGSDPRYAGKAS